MHPPKDGVGDKDDILSGKRKSFNFGQQSRNLRIKDNHLLSILHTSLYTGGNSCFRPGFWLAGRVKGCGVVIDHWQVNKTRNFSLFESLVSLQLKALALIVANMLNEVEYTSTKEVIDYKTKREGKM